MAYEMPLGGGIHRISSQDDQTVGSPRRTAALDETEVYCGTDLRQRFAPVTLPV
jgi:hypothetical protein